MKIYLSSTFTDLADYRKAATDAILRMGHIPVAMEHFAASDTYPVNQALYALGSSDALVLVIGHRYGFIPEFSDFSISQIEYQEANKRKIPIFVFIISDDVPVLPRNLDFEPSIRIKLEHFKLEIRQKHMSQTFSSPEDLKAKVVQSLAEFSQHSTKEVDNSILQTKLSDSEKEREAYRQTIEDLREKLRSVVPAVPIWRSRDFEIDKSLCFVLIPFKDEFFEIYEAAIKPAVEETGLSAIHAGEIFGNKEIVEDIWSKICKARLIVADVTGRNPNVFYELGISHTLGKETVVITQSHDDVPFDIRHRRYIPYEHSKLALLKRSLVKTLQEVLTR